MIKLKSMIKEDTNSPNIIFPDWLTEKIKRVHTSSGQGSIFSMNAEKIKEIVLRIVQNEHNVEKIANSTGVIQKDIPNVGYDLVVTKETANTLPNAEFSTVEKEEGNGKIQVNAVKTSLSKEKFKTNKLTIIVRPQKDDTNKPIPNSYIILSAFPGEIGVDKRASEWGNDFFVVIPSN